MFAPLVLGVFIFGVGASVLVTAALPKWVGWVAIVVGVAALTPLGFFAFLALGLLILIVSGLLLQRSGTTAPLAPS